ncbi:hypothetical protein EHQ61_04705 [Leptospira wolffii]|uniref:hypothetical protein n=1 Tax=Leptospira wolffii TaxID=409998 RepID=UPI00108331E0|nr:hypothetical protein [Leptospira wolffii]TGL53167.1 hypothetical protein EHQ61_04705 [Leptospira wolffii]
MKSKIPYWFAKKIADIINSKYQSFKRENTPVPKWTDWKDCQKFNRNRFDSLLKENSASEVDYSPAWKFRSIQTKNRLQSVYLNSLPSIRETYIKKSINDFARQKEPFEKLSPIFMEAAHLKMTRLNCFARDLSYKEKLNRPTKWYLSAKRNYLRMRFGKFSHIADDYTKWDLCFMVNRRSFDNLKLNPWETTFHKVDNALKLTLKNER